MTGHTIYSPCQLEINQTQRAKPTLKKMNYGWISLLLWIMSSCSHHTCSSMWLLAASDCLKINCTRFQKSMTRTILFQKTTRRGRKTTWLGTSYGYLSKTASTPTSHMWSFSTLCMLLPCWMANLYQTSHQVCIYTLPWSSSSITRSYSRETPNTSSL